MPSGERIEHDPVEWCCISYSRHVLSLSSSAPITYTQSLPIPVLHVKRHRPILVRAEVNS